MRAISQYSKQDLYDMFHFGGTRGINLDNIKLNSQSQKTETKYNTVSIQPGAIQINTQSSDPIETQYAVEAAMASVKIFL